MILNYKIIFMTLVLWPLYQTLSKRLALKRCSDRFDNISKETVNQQNEPQVRGSQHLARGLSNLEQSSWQA